MADRASNSTAGGPVVGGHVLKQLVQTLRGDLNLLSNEARKKYPAVREVWEGGCRLWCAWRCLKILCLSSHGVYCLSCTVLVGAVG